MNIWTYWGRFSAQSMQQNPFCNLMIVKENETAQNVEKLKFSMYPSSVWNSIAIELSTLQIIKKALMAKFSSYLAFLKDFTGTDQKNWTIFVST